MLMLKPMKISYRNFKDIRIAEMKQAQKIRHKVRFFLRFLPRIFLDKKLPSPDEKSKEKRIMDTE